jgi:hypothetical protein
MLKRILFVMMLTIISTSACAERDIQSGTMKYSDCHRTVEHWDSFQRQNWSDGVTWSFYSKYAAEIKSVVVTVTNVLDPRRIISLSCKGDTFSVEQKW